VCAAVLLGTVGGCATMQQTFGGWFGAATPTPVPTPEPAPATAASVYYSGTQGLKVYSEASSSSKIIGELSLYEKVTRSKLERGYAYVTSVKSGVTGWVKNAQLVWRLPGAPMTAAPAPGEAQPEETAAPTVQEPQAPVAPEATATAGELLPTLTAVPPALPTPTATPRSVAPSIFDAY
jgi:hypothetical protein